MRRRYALLDVFTDRPLAGNALAVIRDGEGLDGRQMQAIAAELALSETVFLLPPTNPVHSARLRIFTPKAELPFAGHPTIGASVLLATDRHAAGAGPAEAVLMLELEAGPIRCGAFLRDGFGHAMIAAPHLPSETARAGDPLDIAAALGLDRREVGFENHLPVVYEAGVPFAFVPVHNLAVMARIEPRPSEWKKAFGACQEVFCYTRETIGVGRQFHARMFAPALGIPEDPGTGAAVAALAGVVHRFDALPAGTHRAVIEQGFEMGRPSLITLEMEVSPLQLEAVRVGGDAVVIGEGELTVD